MSTENSQDGMKSPVIKEEAYSKEEYAALRRKIDWHLLPLMWLCYGVQLSDKLSLSTQAVFGIRTDLNLQGQQYQWLTTGFYILFLAAEFPFNYVFQRYNLGKTLALAMFLWGVVVTCIAASRNFTHIMVLRCLQGALESSISPGFLLVIAQWYKRSSGEHVSRTMFFTSGAYGYLTINSLLMYAIAYKAPGEWAWRGISLYLGFLTIVCSIASFFLIGSPKEVLWLDQRHKAMANARVIENKMGIDDRTGIKWDWGQVWEACKDPQTTFFLVNAIVAAIPNGGITTFNNILLNSFGFTNLQVVLIGMPYNFLGFLWFIFIAYITAFSPLKRRNVVIYIMFLSCITPLLGLLGMGLFPRERSWRWIKWGAYMFTACYPLPQYLSYSLLASNVAGKTKKSVTTALNFIGYCVGNMIGSQIFRTSDAPRYIPGIIGACTCFGLCMLNLSLWRLYYMWENRRRDRIASLSDISAEEQEKLGRKLGEDGVSDTSNLYFRYVM